jgi:osmoprotectant transport system permease protein
MKLTLISVAIGFIWAFLLALIAHRARQAEQPISILAALVYTFPSIALFQLLVPFTGLTDTTVEIALISYTIVILFPNFMNGLAATPPETLEAARGMGLTPRQILFRVEVPLALPSILGGLRIAVVSTVAIATIASLIGVNDLGYPIFYAIQLPTPFKTEIYSAGALAVALALALDAAVVLVRRVTVPWARASQ